MVTSSDAFTSSSQTSAINNNEVKTIQTIVAPIIPGAGWIFLLDSPLAASHIGTLINTSFSVGDPNLLLYRKASVGLLSNRNIRIKGDDSSTTSQFGAHVMVMKGATAYISGVQFARVGMHYL